LPAQIFSRRKFVAVEVIIFNPTHHSRPLAPIPPRAKEKSNFTNVTVVLVISLAANLILFKAFNNVHHEQDSKKNTDLESIINTDTVSGQAFDSVLIRTFELPR
jgi:hypothetical protein